MHCTESDIVIGIIESFSDYCYHCSDSRFICPSAKGQEREEGESPEHTSRGAGCRLAGGLQPGRPVPGGQLQEAPEASL